MTTIADRIAHQPTADKAIKIAAWKSILAALRGPITAMDMAR